MNYGWEAELKAEESGFLREELRYVPSQSGSPYMEIVMEELNRTKLPYGVVEINPLYRFAREMAEVFDRNLTEYEDTRMVFFDVFMHYISCLDLRQGLSKQEYALRFLLHDLLKGTCGAAAARVVGDFEKGKQQDNQYNGNQQGIAENRLGPCLDFHTNPESQNAQCNTKKRGGAQFFHDCPSFLFESRLMVKRTLYAVAAKVITVVRRHTASRGSQFCLRMSR